MLGYNDLGHSKSSGAVTFLVIAAQYKVWAAPNLATYFEPLELAQLVSALE